jgi:catechol 2,3-dioxygenase-like lactoylglutathione lyase family enzyme
MAGFELQRLDHVAITVRDVQASVAWYADVLGLERRYDWDEPAMMCAGDTCVAIFSAAGRDLRRDEAAITVTHFAFAATRRHFAAARRVFEERGIPARFADHGLCHSVYITDPDGHTIELTTYDV